MLGFTANPQVPRTCNFNPGLAPSLILRKGFGDYISTIVLGFPELRKQWEYQTKDDPIEQSCPSPTIGFPPSFTLYTTGFREMAKFPLHKSFQNTKQIPNILFFFFWFGKNEKKLILAVSREVGCETNQGRPKTLKEHFVRLGKTQSSHPYVKPSRMLPLFGKASLLLSSRT